MNGALVTACAFNGTEHEPGGWTPADTTGLRHDLIKDGVTVTGVHDGLAWAAEEFPPGTRVCAPRKHRGQPDRDGERHVHGRADRARHHRRVRRRADRRLAGQRAAPGIRGNPQVTASQQAEGDLVITISQLRELVGHEVVMGFEDSMWGATTLRWGTLREISSDGTALVIDGYHDSAGIGWDRARPTDGTPVEVASLRSIRRYYPGSIR